MIRYTQMDEDFKEFSFGDISTQIIGLNGLKHIYTYQKKYERLVSID